ncbi:MAG: hypothetical protein J1E43_02600 [Christensenellaceae bacterium]|nr:hypothetical protein [Christensenellaceae bacterium]
MLYSALERPHTRPSKWVDKGGRRKPRMQERDTRGEVMTFSVDFLPGFSDERGSMTPVYVADRCPRPQQAWTQPTQRPVSAFDTDRKRAPLISSEGISVRAGMGLLLAVLIVMLGVVAISYGQISSINRDANVARERVATLQEMCYEIEAEIARNASEINVSRSAVQMGMISARGMDVIYLTAPETAVMSNPGTGMLSADYLGAVFGE